MHVITRVVRGEELLFVQRIRQSRGCVDDLVDVRWTGEEPSIETVPDDLAVARSRLRTP